MFLNGILTIPLVVPAEATNVKVLLAVIAIMMIVWYGLSKQIETKNIYTLSILALLLDQSVQVFS